MHASIGGMHICASMLALLPRGRVAAGGDFTMIDNRYRIIKINFVCCALQSMLCVCVLLRVCVPCHGVNYRLDISC